MTDDVERASHHDDLDLKEKLSYVEDADSFKSIQEKPGDIELAANEAAAQGELEDGQKLLALKKIIGENREEQEKKLLRKIDLRILPMLMVVFILNYLDRTNISTARLDTLEKDTGLHGNQYNTIIAIFYVGYVLTQLGSNIVLNKARPSLMLPGVMVAWAAVSACCGAVQSYEGWIAARFILGFVESPFFGGSLFFLSSWYTKKELATRFAVFYTACQLSGAFGGLIGEAILNRFQHDNMGISAWRWLFIIEGSITVPFALLAMIVLPDYPHNTKFFNEKERALAELRMLEEASKADDHDESLLKGVKMAFADPVLYMLWIMELATMTAATVNAYFPTIVGTLGYGRTKTLLMTAPPWIFSAVFSLILCLHSDKQNERCWHIVAAFVVALVGFIISACTMNNGARYFSMFLMLGIYGSFTTIFSWVATSLSRPPAKRAIAYAFVNAFANISSTYASYFYPASTGPKYFPAMVCNIAFTVLGIACAITLRYYLAWRNRKLDEANEEDLATEGVRVGTRTLALANRFDCDPHYRFTL